MLQTGLKELLAKGFLAPRSPNLFRVNPALFFKGDRVAVVREYRRLASAQKQPKVRASANLGSDPNKQLGLFT